MNIIITNCSKHENETANVFCHRHCQSLCTKCMLDGHRECVHSNEVEDIGKTFKRAQAEFPDASKSYKRLIERHREWEDHFGETKGELDISEERLTAGLQQMCNRLVEQVKRLSAEALEMVHSVTGEQRSMIEHNLDKLGGIFEKLNTTKQKLEATQITSDVSICEAMLIVNTLARLDNEFKEMEINSKDTKLSFFVSKEFQHIQQNFTSFGELCIEQPNNGNTHGNRVTSSGSLIPSETGLFYTGERKEIFILPDQSSIDAEGQGLYYSIYNNNTNEHCSPPPLPELHPPPLPSSVKRESRKSIVRESFAATTKRKSLERFGEQLNAITSIKSEKTRNELRKSESLRLEKNPGLSIPPLPIKRTSQSMNLKRGDNRVSKEDTSEDAIREDKKKTHLKERHAQIAKELEKLGKSDTQLNVDIQPEDANNSNIQNLLIRPPTLPKPHIRRSNGGEFSSEPKMSPKLGGTLPKVHVSNHFDGSNLEPKSTSLPLTGTLSKPHKFVAELNERVKPNSTEMRTAVSPIPALPTKRKQRRSVIKAFVKRDSSSESSDYAEVHSDNEFLPSALNGDSSAKSVSLIDLSKNLDAQSDQTRVYFYAASDVSSESVSEKSVGSNYSNSSFSSLGSMRRKTSVAEQMDKIFPSDGSGDERSSTSMTSSHSAVLDRRKSRTFRMSTVFGNNENKPTNQPPAHSLFTGLCVTQSRKLFLCDFENHCAQLFDPKGTPLFDYHIDEPFCCCLIREELVAVTSKSRKTVSIFDISGCGIVCKQERVVSPDCDVFGITFTHGFFGLACVERVVILTEKLQHYRTVNPVIMVKKKRTKPFFNDVKYVALEWSAECFRLFTSEHKVERVSCVEIGGNRDKPVWSSHVGKPKALLLSGDNLLIAAKGKIVIMATSNGNRVKEIHHDVPSHPITMVRNGDWLYITKNSTANAESRNIRRIPMV